MTTTRTDRVATYRLQFRGGMDFERAAALVPYLRRLGISHLYASPIFTAAAGSTHGYDVADYNEIDPSLGGRDGFERLSRTLREAGMGLMLDIVPNHMAAVTENGWWRDVIEWGARARHARHFDIDWTRRLTIPTVDGDVGDAIGAGDITLDIDAARRGLVLSYYDATYPVTPPSYEIVSRAIPDAPELIGIAEIAQRATPDAAEEFHAEMAIRLQDHAVAEAVRAHAADADLVARIHDAQPWQFIDWREARRDLSYRRFFEVTGLVGTRVEDAPVFDDIHRLTLELVREGHVDALRIDHIDGLSDPGGYLRRLREQVGPDVWIVVEKIVEGHEQLPAWPVEGTTGYEFIAAMADLLQPTEGVDALQQAYAGLTSAAPAVQRRDAAKRLIVTQNFEGELARLVRLLAHEVEDPDETALRDALIALIVALPVYRTYGDPVGFADADRELLAQVSAVASEMAGAASVDAVIGALSTPGAWELRARFQQLTGPAMAKAVEDTLFYRHTPILAENEVGCDPVAPPGRSIDVHDALAERGRREPEGLNATSTHDTKRGEDARARLYALAGDPARWISDVERWRGWAAEAGFEQAPDAATEWTIYQALAGIWPEHGRPGPEELASMRERFAAFLIKALREAKLRTSWTDEDSAYEESVTAYAARLLDPANERFLADFHDSLRPLIAAGRVMSLAQTLVKLTAGGIPDIYQGSEGGDFSLVDPDNRRPPDFEALARAADAGTWSGSLAERKARLVRLVLAERQRAPRLYSHGDHEPVAVEGPMAGLLFAYRRSDARGDAVVVVPIRGDVPGEAGEGADWEATTIDLPDRGGEWIPALDVERRIAPGAASALSVLGAAGLALLRRS